MRVGDKVWMLYECSIDRSGVYGVILQYVKLILLSRCGFCIDLKRQEKVNVEFNSHCSFRHFITMEHPEWI